MADFLQSKYTQALRTQAKTAVAQELSCPYCSGRIFQNDDQLWDHAVSDHSPILLGMGIDPQNPGRFRKVLRDEAARSLADQTARESHISSEATAGAGSTPDLTQLSLLETKGKSQSPPRPKKRPAGSDIQPSELQSRVPIRDTRRTKKATGYEDPSGPYVEDLDYSRNIPFSVGADSSPQPKSSQRQLFNPHDAAKGAPTLYSQGTQGTPNASSEDWSVVANPHGQHHPTPRPQPKAQRQSPYGSPRHSIGSAPPQYNVAPQASSLRQRGILEVQRTNPRYPDLISQPDARPISQEQLASEVKSIYAGLTMVETKCIHVDRVQASVLPDPDGDTKLANDHWQALIALHRTLLHEHHDFFLASQHPSASPALRRLASKYSMPARMWKHGIHSFLELLRRRLPESLDYMLAFIYLAYQMMSLLYETVPTFEDTWIECLGDLGRYRMAIEDEDLRDRETWAGVARFWYSKAADKSPYVGRLYHHLAILARPNALQQLYYYSRSLTCVVPFMSARESILTLLDPILGRSSASYTHSLPIDTSFIRAHGILFGRLSTDAFEESKDAFLGQLDNHIGRVTAKWNEQGVFIAVTNIAGFFDYGFQDSPLRLIYQSYAEKISHKSQRSSSPSEQDSSSRSPSPSVGSKQLSSDETSSQLSKLSHDVAFLSACRLTFSTFALVLRRIGDKNVLPHVHVLLAFLSSLSTIPYVSALADNAPWNELVTFLNTLSKSERLEPLVNNDIFPSKDMSDNVPLPEDYLIRGQVWSQWYFPESWFGGEHDEEERSLELASTTKDRTERILRLGHQIATLERWIHYDRSSNTWSMSSAFSQVVPGHKSGEYVPQLTHTLLADDMDIDQPAQAQEKISLNISYDLSEDSPEMREIQAEEENDSIQPQHTKSLQPSTALVSSDKQARSSTMTASKMFVQSYTIIVCDTNLLLKQRDVFESLIQNGDWRVVVPDGGESSPVFRRSI
ncbi:uncharacterized protein BDZ99DRAFT_426165 [Mytilinidion resinicola]|uniref:Nonsense-mediated mRNA decay factor n=1 Tax=Mytilinidion resinicola TaxID=574789 RepID=A0A6A6Y5B1_9PEZI|nr:uncharacterized protein BDZ99DRAFT_426165 [Mytilinidion resinicola]KAF2803996.1 hypothetical protein BDZ99DRAFT_426165 [Mytilinidion resinicola]